MSYPHTRTYQISITIIMIPILFIVSMMSLFCALAKLILFGNNFNKRTIENVIGKYARIECL